MVHISGMQKNILLENKKLENVECGLLHVQTLKVVAGVLIDLQNCKE